MNIYFGFSTNNYPTSILARWITKSKASHAFLLVDLFFIHLIIHATFGGVKVVPYTKWIKSNKITNLYALSTPRSREDIEIALAEAFSFVGGKYDYPGFLGFIPIYIMRWFGKKIKNPFASAKAIICTEFILQTREELKINSWTGLDAESISQQDIIEICDKSDEFVSVKPPNLDFHTGKSK